MHAKPKTAFWISLFFVLFGPLWFPKLHILYFAPFLVLSLYAYRLPEALLRAFFAGLCIDLLCFSSHFGLCSLNYCLATLFLYSQKYNFFQDKFISLPLMTALFSILSTLLFVGFSIFFDLHFLFSLSWAATDLLIMPLLDALFALLLFSLPFHFFKRWSRVVRR